MELSFSRQSAKGSILTRLLGEDLSAVQLSEKMDLGQSAIRNHLSFLEKEGYVDHYFKKVSKGRPKKMYTITPAGRNLFPRKYELFLTYLLREIEDRFDKETLQNILKDVAADLAKRLGEDLPEKNQEDRLRELVDSFEDWGLCPTLSVENEEYHITYRNCAFFEIVGEFAEYLCNMHREIITDVMTDCDVEQEECCGKGDNVCVHRVIPRK